MVLEKTLESLLDCKEIKPVYSKENQSWIFIARNDDETEAPILWPPDAKRQLTGKDLYAGKDWGAEEKGDNRGWDGWMPSPTRWTWVCVNPGSWWWTGRPGVLQFMGSQRVGHNWATHTVTLSLCTVILKPKIIKPVTVLILSLFAMKWWNQVPWS